MYQDYSTGSGAIARTLDPSATAMQGFWKIPQVDLHLDAVGGAGAFTLTVDSAKGSEYDVLVFSQDMTAVADAVWIPERPFILGPGDSLVAAWANVNGKTYGLRMLWDSNR